MGTTASPVIHASDYTYENTRVVCSWRFMSMFLSRLVFLLLAIIQNCLSANND
jgi:hypothetical protein